jgi:hypothetical protein
MSQSMRDALQAGIALLGTALASIGSAGYLPSSVQMVAAGGGGLALVAMLEKAWRNNRDEIIEEIEDFVEDKTGLEIELDEVVDEIVETGLEVATDVAEDGDLDTPLGDVAEELAEDIAENLEETLKDMTVNALREMLSERGLDTKGKKVALIERLLNA